MQLLLSEEAEVREGSYSLLDAGTGLFGLWVVDDSAEVVHCGVS